MTKMYIKFNTATIGRYCLYIRLATLPLSGLTIYVYKTRTRTLLIVRVYIFHYSCARIGQVEIVKR